MTKTTRTKRKIKFGNDGYGNHDKELTRYRYGIVIRQHLEKGFHSIAICEDDFPALLDFIKGHKKK
jgi:hypothetical protein